MGCYKQWWMLARAWAQQLQFQTRILKQVQQQQQEKILCQASLGSQCLVLPSNWLLLEPSSRQMVHMHQVLMF
jgi:hypothetical protein